MSTLLEPTTEGVSHKYVNAGETPKLTFVMTDTENVSLDGDSLTSISITIKDPNGDIINSRDDQSILNENNGSLSSTTLTFKLQAADTAFQSSTGFEENHYVRLKWVWTDADAESRTGMHDYYYRVRKMEV